MINALSCFVCTIHTAPDCAAMQTHEILWASSRALRIDWWSCHHMVQIQQAAEVKQKAMQLG